MKFPIGCRKPVVAVFALFLTLSAVVLHAQIDSISLKEVTVKGVTPVRYFAGLYIHPIDSTTLRQFRFQRLNDLLSRSTTLVFRDYGSGQLSTISFRGLSPNHTAVLWNGVNINMPSLGQTDFSTIPTVSFDQASVQFGAGAAHLGSDAVGGSVLIESRSPDTNGLLLAGGFEYGSFRNRSGQTALRFRRQLGKEWFLSGSSRFYQIENENRFRTATFKGRRLEQSESSQSGFLQDLYVGDRRGRTFSLHTWLSDNLVLLNPHEPILRERTSIDNFRSLARYADGRWQISGSFIRDRTDFGVGENPVPDQLTTYRTGLKTEREFSWKVTSSDVSVLAGVEIVRFQALSAQYANKKTSENRGDAFVLSRFSHPAGWVISLSARQALAEGFRVPFTPSAGVEYALFSKGQFRAKVTGSIARSYRVPTLNERYWRGLGSRDIKPESGLNKELGWEQQLSFSQNLHLKNRLNFFHNKVDNWIYWNPTKKYQAENLQLVLSRGAELFNELVLKQSKWVFRLQNQTGYTRNTQEKAYDSYSGEILGKQLRFVPLWVSNWNLHAENGNNRFSLQWHGESVRFTTTDHSQYLPAYFLLNLMYEHKLRFRDTSVSVQTRINNLTDQLYLNVKSNAMPGRSFYLSLFFDFHIIQSKS